MTWAGGPGQVLMDRHVLHEVGQLVRALEANGAVTEEELAVLVGAPYWEKLRYRRAVDFMLGQGLAHRDRQGLIHPG